MAKSLKTAERQRYVDKDDVRRSEVWRVVGRAPDGKDWELRRAVPRGHTEEHRFVYLSDEQIRRDMRRLPNRPRPS